MPIWRMIGCLRMDSAVGSWRMISCLRMDSGVGCWRMIGCLRRDSWVGSWSELDTRNNPRIGWVGSLEIRLGFHLPYSSRSCLSQTWHYFHWPLFCLS